MIKKLSRTNNTILGKMKKKSKVWAKFAIVTSQHKKFCQGKLKPKNMIRNLIHPG